MRLTVANYLLAAILLWSGLFGTGAVAIAQELRDPMQPPPFALRKFREAKLAKFPRVVKPAETEPKPEPMRLTSIIYSAERKIAIIDDQMLALGDHIRGAKLVGLTRESARLVRKGKVIKLSLGTVLTVIRKKVVGSDL